MAADIAIIGGSGLYALEGFEQTAELESRTPYGDTSTIIQSGQWQSTEVVFFPRHGKQHQVPPHKINYRANIWSLKQAGVSRIIAVNAVGGIHPKMGPESIVVPDQIVDYTWGREQSFSDGTTDTVQHIDFTYPYSEALRDRLIRSAASLGLEVFDRGVYGCTNGPRLETAAEIRRMANDGCDLVGMTGMPEASLAREAELEYAALAFVVNTAAGLGDGKVITMDEILGYLDSGVKEISALLAETVRQMSQ